MGLTTIALVKLVELLYSVLLVVLNSKRQTMSVSDVEPDDQKLPTAKEWTASMNANQPKSANLYCIVKSQDGEEETMSTTAIGVEERKSTRADTEKETKSTPSNGVGETTSTPVVTEAETKSTSANVV